MPRLPSSVLNKLAECFINWSLYCLNNDVRFVPPLKFLINGLKRTSSATFIILLMNPISFKLFSQSALLSSSSFLVLAEPSSLKRIGKLDLILESASSFTFLNCSALFALRSNNFCLDCFASSFMLLKMSANSVGLLPSKLEYLSNTSASANNTASALVKS